MSIYGNHLTNNETSSILENYIENSFLEMVLNEAVNSIESEIKALKDQDKVSTADIKSIQKKINEISDTKTKTKLTTQLTIALTSMFTSYAGLLMAAAEMTIGLPLTAAGIIGMLATCASLDKNVADKAYYDIMKTEAKARVALKKAEKLDDTERVKELQKVIDICEELKKERKNFLKDKMVNAQQESVVYEEYDYLTEFKGNDVKNDIFIQVLDDCDDICKMNIDKIKTYEATVLKIFDLMKTSKDKNVVKQNLTKARQVGRDTNDAIKKIKDIYGPITFGFIKTEVKKFNNKYSYITMAEKKKLAAKLDQYKAKLREYGEKYKADGSFDKQLIPYIDKLESIDITARNEFISLINSWLDGIVNEVNWTMEDINYILNLLDIQRTEKSIVYKALNIGKKSKEDNE